MNNLDEVHEVARMREKHVVSHQLDGSGHDNVGWVKAEIKQFETAESDDNLILTIELPWGEEHMYFYKLDNLFSGNFRKLCSAYGYDVSEHELLEGEPIWVKLRYIDMNGGEITSGTRINYGKVKTGPKHWRRYAVLILSLAVMMFLGIFAPVII